VLIEIDRLILKTGRNPVELSSRTLRQAGLYHGNRARALRKLEEAGVIRVGRRGQGQSPLVTHLWRQLSDR
jgi:hypothetical protein